MVHACSSLSALLLCLGLWCAPALAQQHFKLNASVAGSEAPCLELKFGVLTVTQTRQDLIMRVGVLNPTAKLIVASQPLKTDDFSLSVLVKGQRLVVHPTTTTLTDLFPAQGLLAKSAHTGLLTFPWGSAELPSMAIDDMELRVPGFPRLALRLTAAQLFEPIQWEKVAKRSALNLEVPPLSESLAIFPMRLHALTVQDQALELTVSFKNASRFPVQWKGDLGGEKALLFTEHGERLEPLDVSKTLRHRLAPEGKTWEAGEDNLGWIRFPLPNPLAANRLGFVLPAYGVTFLDYEPASASWKPKTHANPADAAPTKVEQVLAEERTFDQLKQFWRDATQDWQRQDWQGYLRHFRGVALQDQQLGLAPLPRAPLASLEFRLSEFQPVKPDAEGRLRSVRVDLRYTIASLPPDNLFITQSECDMQRDDAGNWHVDFMGYPDLQPFWLLGYTETRQAEHFVVFYRPDKDGAAKADTAARQLEKGYARLRRTTLSLKSRYAAFAISRKDDFHKLAGRDPLTYSGAASAGYLMREGRMQVTNEALYLNDFRFFTLQRAWGKQDRQLTILHELVHLALADLTRPWTPAWLVEGMAMHYAEQCDSFTRSALAEHLTAATSLTNLTKLSHLGAITQDPAEVMTQYLFSGETLNHLVRQHGEETVLQLYARFAKELPAEWRGKRGDENNAPLAAARLAVTRRVLSQVMPALTLEELDLQVRRKVKGE